MEMQFYVKKRQVFISNVVRSSAPWSGFLHGSIHACSQHRRYCMSHSNHKAMDKLLLIASSLKVRGFDVLRGSQSSDGVVGCPEGRKRSVEAAEVVPTMYFGRSPSTFLAMCCLGIQLALVSPSLAAITIPDPDTFENVPSQLSSSGEAAAVPLSSVVSGPKKREIESCTRKCVPTCIRGGEGAPGLGPISVRKEIVVFKEGFRSRQYCLSECAQVCALSLDKEMAAKLSQPIQ